MYYNELSTKTKLNLLQMQTQTNSIVKNQLKIINFIIYNCDK